MTDEIGIPVVFWASETGTEPVRDWLKQLDKEDRRQIGEDIKTVQFGWPVGMLVCRPLGKGLFEVRSRLSEGRIARMLFCFHDNRIVLLHGFIKKTQKTPKPDLDLALKRQKQME
jgi:phage-related protein